MLYSLVCVEYLFILIAPSNTFLMPPQFFTQPPVLVVIRLCDPKITHPYANVSAILQKQH